ncbi:Lipase [Grifola frondosa]|uniref:Lipase n=1 Tax=Grifola frondosa TaxID=5627 RepID=A0A1C7M9Y6_GRIFR|nr:Lipase [Grifola frondosa]
MLSPFRLYTILLITLSVVRAVPPPAEFRRRQSITALSPSQVAALKPYSYYASAGYCAANATLAWDCGAICQANPSFQPVASGGDGSSVQFWFVGFDPTLNTIIVSHQGTNPQDILPLLTDGDLTLEKPDATLFPGLDSSIEVHSGFAQEQAKTATSILGAVSSAISKYGTKSVTLTGHSLGAAIALLDAAYLPLHIPELVVTFIGYGLPRVGDQSWANYLDAQPISVTHINNQEDFVPTLPGMFLGYHHPSGEVHIVDSGSWLACPGQDNASTECIVGDVPSIFSGNESDHDGPYGGVEMGSC